MAGVLDADVHHRYFRTYGAPLTPQLFLAPFSLAADAFSSQSQRGGERQQRQFH